MKKNFRRTLYVVILTGLGGCQRPHFVANKHRTVTISISPSNSSQCEVDYPVAFLRISKQHTIAWASDDNAYFILFHGGINPVGSNPTTNSVIQVPAAGGGHPTDYPLTISPSQANYFSYGIYTSDPTQNPNAQACKTWDDDHDTALNVKQ